MRQRVPFAKIRPKWKVVWWDQDNTVQGPTTLAMWHWGANGWIEGLRWDTANITNMTCSQKVEGSSKLCFCEFWKCFWMECIPSLDCKLRWAVLKTCFLPCMNKQEQEGLPTSMFTQIFVGFYFKTWIPYWTIWPGPLRSKFAKSEKIIGICSHWPSSTLHPAFNRDIGHTDYYPLMIGICSKVLTRFDPSRVFIKIKRR